TQISSVTHIGPVSGFGSIPVSEGVSLIYRSAPSAPVPKAAATEDIRKSPQLKTVIATNTKANMIQSIFRGINLSFRNSVLGSNRTLSSARHFVPLLTNTHLRASQRTSHVPSLHEFGQS